MKTQIASLCTRALSCALTCLAVGCAPSHSTLFDASSLSTTGAPVNAPIGSAIGDGGAGVMQGRRRVPDVDPSVDPRVEAALRRPFRVAPWTHGTRTGHEIVTEHLEIRTTLSNSELRRYLPEFTECALAHYTSALGTLPAPSQPLETYIFGTREEWAAFTVERLDKDAEAYLSLGRGGYTSNATAILYDIGANDTLTILAHEGWHQYSQAVFRAELPVWLEEGISTYMEGYIVSESGLPNFEPWRNFERFGQLRDSLRQGAIIPLEQLLAGTPQRFLADGRERLLAYYAQVWVLTHFLAEGSEGRYRAGLEMMLQDAVTGSIGTRLASAVTTDDDRRSVRRALDRGGVRALPSALILRAYFSADLPTLAAEYDTFLRAICARGSGDRIWRGVSPIRKPAAAKPAAR
ncbi:MAG: hypothetical protein EXS17_07860 [Phycisphaerales bacterium]|nr:hypothetical protein [Phycisphaerales bacterium]